MAIIETRSRQNILSLLLYFIGSTLPVILLISLFQTNYQNIEEIFYLLLPSIGVGFVGVLSFRMFLWFVNGEECVYIENGYLIILKKGTFWIRKKKQIPLMTIEKIVINKSFHESYSPSRLVHKFSRQMYIFKIQNTGRIKIYTNGGKTYKFLDNISFDTASSVIGKITLSKNGQTS